MKEAPRDKYFRLRKEVAEMNEDLNERQRIGINPENLTSDYSSVSALIKWKEGEMKKIEAQM